MGAVGWGGGLVGCRAREGRGLGRVPACQRANRRSKRVAMRPRRLQMRTSNAVRARSRAAVGAMAARVGIAVIITNTDGDVKRWPDRPVLAILGRLGRFDFRREVVDIRIDVP